MKIIKAILSLFLGALLEAIINACKKSPEKKAKEREREILNKNIDDLNSDRKPYELPVGVTDKWGDEIGTETRVESGKTDDSKRSEN